MSNINTTPIMAGFGIVLALAATVLLYIFVLPEKKREKLPKLLQMAHDIFNFKGLLLETLIKGVYVLSTVACITVGLCSLLGFNVYESYYSGLKFQWAGGYGLLLMIVGPIVLRILFELVMMFILLGKNTIEINNKLKNKDEE